MINSYIFGSVTVDNQKFIKDLIIFPDHIAADWRRKSGHFLAEDDILEIMEYRPRLLIIGTGAYGLMKVSDKLIEKLKVMRIEFKAMKTSEAVEEYNRNCMEEKVVCALHLTC